MADLRPYPPTLPLPLPIHLCGQPDNLPRVDREIVPIVGEAQFLVCHNLDSIACIAITITMTTLTIRKLDEEIKSRLKIRAAINGHSMEQEARLILKKSLEEHPADERNGMQGIERWRGRWKNRLSSEEILQMTRGS